jgi:hypothetical protein
MAHGNRRKCKCCLKLFRPDPRNHRHQSYCSVSACRAASKAASQAREPRLLPRPGEHRPGQGLAVAPSRLLAQWPAHPPCVTRGLNGSTN